MTRTKFIDFRALDDLNEYEKTRINRVIGLFEEATGAHVKYIIRSPGRINLIGDHVDYHGFSVLPMAIENSILVCVSTVESLEEPLVQKRAHHGDSSPQTPERKHLIILNADQELYPAHQCEHSFRHGAMLDQSHRWYHYVVCGYHGVIAKELLQLDSSQIYDHAKRTCSNRGNSNGHPCSEQSDSNHLDKLDNMIVFVDSDLPPASGLSSSSALVCASALATHLALWDHNKKGSKQANAPLSIASESLAEDCAKFEHLVGTHGGGMDQAVILTAQDGYAKHIEFMPRFRCSNVHLPQDVVWLVSHCGESYSKAATSGFNSRVLETKLAAALIIKKLKPSSGLPLDHTITLCKVKDELFGFDASASEFLAAIESQVLNELKESTFDEVSFHLEVSRTDLLRRFNTSEDFLMKSGLNSRLCLHKRCKHVLEESDRVRQFKLICEMTGDPVRLGKLMTESHLSLRDNYECSHPALDRLVDISLEAGALGARLTGAGWGGCIVSLVESGRAKRVSDELMKVSKFTFRTEPQSGASIIQVLHDMNMGNRTVNSQIVGS